MNIKNFLFLNIYLATLIALIVVSGCEKTIPSQFECQDILGCVNIGPEEPIKLGVLQALSGEVGQLGLEQIRGIELAFDQGKNEISGHPIALQIEDTGCTGEGGANTVLKIIAEPQTVAILGTTCSGAAAKASQAMSDSGLTMVSGNNSAPFLTSIAGKKAPDWHAGYFRTAPNEENAGKAAALFAFQKLNIRKAATINDGDIYTRGLTNAFSQAFTELGGEVVLDTAVNKGDVEMGPALEAVVHSQAEFLFFPLFQPEGNHVLFQARKIPVFSDIILMSGGALIESSFILAVQEKGNGMYFVGPLLPTTPATEAVADKYFKKYNSKPATKYYLSAYDSANLLMAAIEKVAVREPDNTLHIGRQALRDALYSSKKFQGVTGNLTCDEFGDCAEPHFNILQLDDPSAGVEGLQANIIFSL